MLLVGRFWRLWKLARSWRVLVRWIKPHQKLVELCSLGWRITMQALKLIIQCLESFHKRFGFFGGQPEPAPTYMQRALWRRVLREFRQPRLHAAHDVAVRIIQDRRKKNI